MLLQKITLTLGNVQARKDMCRVLLRVHLGNCLYSPPRDWKQRVAPQRNKDTRRKLMKEEGVCKAKESIGIGLWKVASDMGVKVDNAERAILGKYLEGQSPKS